MSDVAYSMSVQPINFERLVQRIEGVSSLPHVSMRVLEVVNSSESTVADLRSVVESDPSLVARILRTVNSSAFGLRVRVDSIHRAVALLGFNMIKNLAVTASVAQMFRDNTPIGRYTRPKLWKHMISVAVASRMIASRSGIKEFDEAYMCGLLHDIGIILIDQHQHRGFLEVVGNFVPDRSTAAIEREILGFDHTQLGAAIAEKWGFPDSVIDTIRFHHNSARCTGEYQPLVYTVEVANFLCTKKGISSYGVNQIQPPTKAVFDSLSIGRNDVKILYQDLDVELDKAKELFRI